MSPRTRYRSEPRGRQREGGWPPFSNLGSGSAYDSDLQTAGKAADAAEREELQARDYEDGTDRTYLVGHHDEADCRLEHRMIEARDTEMLAIGYRDAMRIAKGMEPVALPEPRPVLHLQDPERMRRAIVGAIQGDGTIWYYQCGWCKTAQAADAGAEGHKRCMSCGRPMSLHSRKVEE